MPFSPDDTRPNPDELLRRARDEELRAKRGKLKVFFGFAPGVGKTCAMLDAARRLRAEGVDVVIGWVETHGRKETEALAADIPRLTPRLGLHGGHELPEFDVAAAIVRRPALLLVDELAHTNAAGGLHAKRWQDVEELRDAGIDIWTTLNVQHLESLNDVVAASTGVVVRETVPDAVFDGASEIELVDLPPEDLLTRLRSGKVYIAERIERALDGFFRRDNLVALRELALRRVAERIETDVQALPRMSGTGTVAIGERVLVAVGPAPSSGRIIRAAARMARRLHAPWIALSVETPAQLRLSAADRERIASHLELAERLGGLVVCTAGEDVAAAILAAAREHRVSRIVLGKPRPGALFVGGARRLVQRVVEGSGEIDIVVTAGTRGARAETSAHRTAPPPLRPRPYLGAVSAIGIATAVNHLARIWFAPGDQAMTYLVAIAIVGLLTARGPALAAAVLSVAAFDFFFVEPLYTFAVTDSRNVVTFVVLLLAGAFVGSMSTRLREQADAARLRETRTNALYSLTRALAAQRSADEVARTAAEHISQLFSAPARVMLADAQGGLRESVGPAADVRGDAVARWAFDHGRPAGAGSDTLAAAEELFLPLAGADGALGVVAVGLGARAASLSPPQRSLLENAVRQTASALERVRSWDEATHARLAAETESMRSALLSAVSHDLRTPLAAITGSASALLDDAAPLDHADARELLESIRGEAEHLGELVAGLLDLTRLDSGALVLRKEWCPLEEIVLGARDRAERRLGTRTVELKLPDEMLLVSVDPTLMEQVFINLFDNAAKYTPPGTRIEVSARAAGDRVVVEVADNGPGIPAGEEERIFERFYRPAGSSSTGGAGGTGLGLAVCRAALRAHGGDIRAANRPQSGALFTLEIPAGPPPPSGEGATATDESPT